MTRYRTVKIRSEESKRNLKVDIRRVPEWEAELKSFPTYFKNVDLAQVKSAAILINHMRQVLHVWYSGDGGWPSEQQKVFEKWVSSLSVNDLINLSDSMMTPTFMSSDYELRKDLAKIIQSGLNEAEKKLAEFRVKGITNSFLISLVTSKIDVRDVESIERTRKHYLSLMCEIPRIENARHILLVH